MSRSFRPSSSNRRYKRKVATETHSLEIQQWLLNQRSSYRWKKLSKLVRAINPICMNENCDQPAIDTHHVKPAFMHQDLFYNLDNLVSLCGMHHSEVSALERGGRYKAAIALYENTAIKAAKAYYDSQSF